MYFSKLLYPVNVLGPGKRAAIWLCGCKKKCFNCANPELQSFNEKCNIPIDTVKNIISSLPYVPDGFTVTGGEPFEQSAELAELVKYINAQTDDILIYSGYTLDELISLNCPDINYVLNNISALVDGRYIEELNNNNMLKGSDNQRLYVFRKQYEEAYRKLDNMTDGKIKTEVFMGEFGSIVTTGFHKKNFKDDFKKTFQEHTVQKDGVL